MKLEGIIASKGKSHSIEGKVFISDDPNFTPPFEYYILVTKNPNPDMYNLLSNSRGLVLNIGGITSHLAVVSRELELPCIVQCDYSGLSTGDYIRADLSNGIGHSVIIEVFKENDKTSR